MKSISTSFQPRLRRISALMLTVGLSVILAGCINYEQTTTLNMDGSGTARVHYWAEEDVVSFLNSGPLAFDESKVEKKFAGEGVNITSVKSEMDEEDSTRHVYVELEFEHINKLAETDAFEDVDIAWEPSGDMMKFTQKMSSGEDAGSLGMDGYTVSYTYNMPAEIISSNATDHDGTTLTWKYELSDLGGEGVTMSATVQKAGAFGDIATKVAIVLGVLIILVIVFIAVRKKSKGISASEYSAAPEAPPVEKPAVEDPSDLGEKLDTPASGKQSGSGEADEGSESGEEDKKE